MSEKPETPAPKPPEKSAFDRMKDLTRRIISVPKSELPRKTKGKRKRESS